MSDRLTDGAEDAWTGAMTDGSDENRQMVILLGFQFTICFSPILPGNFNRFSADGDGVND